MIPFNKPLLVGTESANLKSVLDNLKFSGDGVYTNLCHEWFNERLGYSKCLLTTSCTHALEMAALLLDIKPDDEVIMPSYTFVSTANAFILRGAKIKFVDIRPDTMNMDEKLVEAAITKKTKVIVPVHYAGVSVEMEPVLELAKHYGIAVVEDAAQGMMATYKDLPLGSMGDIGTYSFHESKNYHCGEGGLIILNKKDLYIMAEVIREKGTNRSQFFRGMVDKYSWKTLGSSYLPSELNAAILWSQLESAHVVNDNRLASWNSYYEGLSPLFDKGVIDPPCVPEHCVHNGHIFFIKTKDLHERTRLIEHLAANEIMAVFHYVPLHGTEPGQRFGQFVGKDNYTTKESDRLVRLPLYYKIKSTDIDKVINSVTSFYRT